MKTKFGGWDNFVNFMTPKRLKDPNFLWHELQNEITTKSSDIEASDDQTFLYWRNK